MGYLSIGIVIAGLFIGIGLYSIGKGLKRIGRGIDGTSEEKRLKDILERKAD